jgi:DNA-directed RNA polymerase specialized sigma24 family protein
LGPFLLGRRGPRRCRVWPSFYRAERKPLVRFVMFLGCADAGTAEDITQTAFAEALARAWSRTRGHGGSG